MSKFNPSDLLNLDFNKKLKEAYGEDINMIDRTPLLDMYPSGIITFMFAYQIGLFRSSLNFVQVPGTEYYTPPQKVTG